MTRVGAIVPISGLVDEVDEGPARLFGAGFVLFVLTTMLPVILRRLQRARERQWPARQTPLELLTDEVVAIADRIDALNSGGVIRTPEIRREVERLRDLAHAYRD
ncbi:MAG: hypothetical protein ACRDSN_04040 [Pseudonocardiaceae bacterium]